MKTLNFIKFLPTFFLFVTITNAQSTTTNPFDFPDFPQMPDFGNMNNFNPPSLPDFSNSTTTPFPNVPNFPDLPVFDDSVFVNIGTTSTSTTASSTGVLKVDSIETVNSNAIADNTFQNGLRYVFNITVPSNEPLFAMRFADWVSSNSGGTISAGNNIQISSAQASSTAPVLITQTNVYHEPIYIVGDLDANMAGKQIKVLVETKIPIGTQNGNYATNYGVRTQ